MSDTAVADVLTAEVHQRQVTQVRQYVAQQVERAWLRLGDWDTEADVARFVAQAQELVAPAQTTVAELAAGYVSTAAGADPLVLEGTYTTAALRGTPVEEVYRRPFVQLWNAVANGKDLHDALDAARARAGALASDDVSLADRHAMREAMGKVDGITGYRRVLSGRNCVLCATAATKRYHVRDLLPIHTHCDCGIAPIFGDSDPGLVINKRLLDALEDGKGGPYWEQHGIVEVADDGTITVEVNGKPTKVRAAVHEHGELGPTLTDARHDFTGPSAVKPVSKTGPPPGATQAPLRVEPDLPTPTRAPTTPGYVLEEAEAMGARWRDTLTPGRLPSDTEQLERLFARDLERMYNLPDLDGYSVKIYECMIDPEENGVVWYARIMWDETGEQVGRMERSMMLAEPGFGGGHQVGHDLFKIDRSHRGQGLASQLNTTAEEFYRGMGVSDVTLEANIDVGGYAWARQGFDWAGGEDDMVSAVNYMTGRIVYEARDLPNASAIAAEVDAVRARVAAGEWVTPFELSRIGYTEGATTWPGKAGMLGSHWPGVKKL